MSWFAATLLFAGRCGVARQFRVNLSLQRDLWSARSQPASFPSWVRRLQKSYKADYNPGLPVSAPAPWVLIQPPDFPHRPLVPALCSHRKPCGRLQGTRLRLICRDVEEGLSLNSCWPEAGCEKPSLLGKSIPGRLLFKSVSSTDWQWAEILIHRLQQNS